MATLNATQILCRQKTFWVANYTTSQADQARTWLPWCLYIIAALMIYVAYASNTALEASRTGARGRRCCSPTLTYTILALTAMVVTVVVMATFTLAQQHRFYCEWKPVWANYKGGWVGVAFFVAYPAVVAVLSCVSMLINCSLAGCSRRAKLLTVPWGMWGLIPVGLVCAAYAAATMAVLMLLVLPCIGPAAVARWAKGWWNRCKERWQRGRERRSDRALRRQRPARPQRPRGGRRWLRSRDLEAGRNAGAPGEARAAAPAEADVELQERNDDELPGYHNAVERQEGQAAVQVQRPERVLSGLFPHVKDTAAPPPYAP
ncbi:hypothetical protein BAUCODRAFT_32548 [Baudoinia panamericana UAMH 10762]|uniref:Uncharacterized protein n=1 Tax=Baudoinia panamericana (strain UAMH 10762) TaxID=717646 RepID=M2LV73_BAUPA|nr:uncharacterized protein BAUCODRAFT_32548 [Baudoinia panamericana UAMH 10762]EMC98502.1 hypothetical protein BAUCODRAFT_32548 [Baudoinia panamericana UAMH 10762]